MHSHPTYSIITVCLNSRQGIERTEKSISAQKNRDFEWIVIDGGSADGTVQFLEKTGTANCMVSEKDDGIYDAMNKGIKCAYGEYCLFLNAGDELYDCTVLEKTKKFLNADIVIGRMQIVCPNNPAKNEIRNSELQDIRKKYLYSRSLPHQAAFIRRELFFTHGLYDPDFRLAGDHDFFARTLLDGASLSFAPICVSVFYLDGISMKMKHSDLLKNELIRLRKKNFSLFYRSWRKIRAC